MRAFFIAGIALLLALVLETFVVYTIWNMCFVKMFTFCKPITIPTAVGIYAIMAVYRLDIFSQSINKIPLGGRSQKKVAGKPP